MAAFAEKREVQFIAVYVIAMLFLGISKETTTFIFPGTGDKIYDVINFYFVGAVALMVAISWLAQNNSIPYVPKVPPLWAIGVNFIIFFPLFYIFLHFIFTGTLNLTIPTLTNIVIESAISFNENFIAFILLPTLLPWGKGTGSIIKGNIFTIKGYTLKYDVPNLNRMRYGLPSIFIISILHVGSYSQNVSSFNEFYVVLAIAFILFFIMYGIKETFGFGAAEGGHLSWNLTLLGLRGAVI
ncbi:MAG: hypothetical protein PHP06_06000 [Clostridia bacterium]|nr:hypothetical protein [Clostridia bacterium]